MAKSMNSTILTEMKAGKDMTEEQAKAIMDTLVRRAGYKQARMKWSIDGMYVPAAMREDGCCLFTWIEVARDDVQGTWPVKVEPSDVCMWSSCVRQLLEKCANGCRIVVVDMDFSNTQLMTMKRTLMQAGTTFENLLIMMDLAV